MSTINQFISNNTEIERLSDELKSIEIDDTLLKEGIHHYLDALQHRKYAFINGIGRQLLAKIVVIDTSDSSYLTAQAIQTRLMEIRKQMEPMLSLLGSAEYAITSEVVRCLNRRHLEDTDDNRQLMLKNARNVIQIGVREWYALYLNDLNCAASDFKGPRAAAAKELALDAIAHIINMKKMMDQMPANPNNQRMYEAAMARIEEVDKDGSLRYEMTLCGQAKTFGKQALKRTVGLGASLYILVKTTECLKGWIGAAPVDVLMVGMSARGFYHSCKTRNYMGMAFSGLFLYSHISKAYQYFSFQEERQGVRV